MASEIGFWNLKILKFYLLKVSFKILDFKAHPSILIVGLINGGYCHRIKYLNRSVIKRAEIIMRNFARRALKLCSIWVITIIVYNNRYIPRLGELIYHFEPTPITTLYVDIGAIMRLSLRDSLRKICSCISWHNANTNTMYLYNFHDKWII